MNRKIILKFCRISAIIILLLEGACLPIISEIKEESPLEFNKNFLSEIKKGETTKEEIKEIFGSPNTMGISSSPSGSREFWSYLYYIGEEGFIGTPKSLRRILKLTFEGGKVFDWEYSEILPGTYPELKKSVGKHQITVSNLIEGERQYEEKKIILDVLMNKDEGEDFFVRGAIGFARGEVSVQKFWASDGKNNLLVLHFYTKGRRINKKKGEELIVRLQGMYTNRWGIPIFLAWDDLMGPSISISPGLYKILGRHIEKIRGTESS